MAKILLRSDLNRVLKRGDANVIHTLVHMHPSVCIRSDAFEQKLEGVVSYRGPTDLIRCGVVLYWYHLSMYLDLAIIVERSVDTCS